MATKFSPHADRSLRTHISLAPFRLSKAGWLGLLAALLLLTGGLAGRWWQAAAARPVIAREQPVQAVYGGFLSGGASQADERAASYGESGLPAGGQARVDVPTAYYDFGSIGPRQVVRRDFLVINRGSQPLVITRAYTTCACAVADISASQVPPGQAALVTVTFDAGLHNVSGKTVRRGLVLETNDPERPQVEIWVQAAVR